jgi:transposase
MNTHHPNRALSQKEMEARRLKAVPYFNKKWSERRIAAELGVSGPSVHAWKVAWKARGNKGLLAGVYGRKSFLSSKEVKKVKQNILKGAEAHGFSGDFWTLARLTRAVKRWTGIQYEDRSIWHLLKRFGFSCQRPTQRAVERDEKAITTWIQETWPHVKKGASKTV